MALDNVFACECFVEFNLYLPLNKIWHGRRPQILRKVFLAYVRTLCEHKKEEISAFVCVMFGVHDLHLSSFQYSMS